MVAHPKDATQIPGPRGLPILGSLLDFRRDVLGLMVRAMHEHGDIVRFRLGPLTAFLLCHPDHVEQVLKNHQGYDKATRASKMIRLVTGEGLLVTNGRTWETQRRLVAPAFSPRRVASFLPLIQDETHRMLDRWSELAPRGEPIDVASEMMRLTYRVVEKALFHTETGEELDAVERAIGVAIEYAYRRVGTPVQLPLWTPTRANWRFQRAMRTLNGRVSEIIERRRSPDQDASLLASLMDSRCEVSGPNGQTESLRSQSITLLLAGHETTANALTWLWYLLSQHAHADAGLHAETMAVMEGDQLSADHVDRLDYTDLVIREALRLYTPIWAIVRRATADDEIGGYHLPAGARVVISPYVTHRHPAFWESPEDFDPERFSPERSCKHHPYAYIPFGAGPRYCIGQGLARLEMLVITAMVVRRFRLRLAPGHVVRAVPGITLRARHGMPMFLERRENSEERQESEKTAPRDRSEVKVP